MNRIIKCISKFTFFILFLLILNGCGWMVVHIYDLDPPVVSETSNSENNNNENDSINAPPLDVFSVSVDAVLSTQVKMSWLINNSNDSYKIIIGEGSSAPQSCTSNNNLILNTALAGVNNLTLNNLLPNTLYSGRICTENTLGIVSSGITFQFTTLIKIQIKPYYSSFGNWNDYLNNDGSNGLNASGTTCIPTSPNTYFKCLHGGQILTADLPSGLTCSSISIEDELNAFRWKCIDGVLPKIVSVDFKQDKGLQNLVTSSSFKLNYVKVKLNNTISMASEPAQWWSNPVLPLPQINSGGSFVLTNSEANVGSIYAFDHDQESGQVVLSADKQSLVGINGAVLKSGSTPIGPLVISKGTIMGEPKFIWIEGSFDGANLESLIYLRSAPQSRLHNLVIYNSISTGYGIYINNNNSVLIDNFNLYNINDGIRFTNSNGISLLNGKIQNSGQGIGTNAVNLNNSCLHCYLSDILIANFKGTGISLPSSAILQRITLSNISETYALNIANQTNKSFITNILSINNKGGISVFNYGGNTFSQLAIGDSTINNDLIFGSIDIQNKFTQQVLLSSTPSCAADGILSGFTNACEIAGTSDATILKTLDVNKVFRGPIKLSADLKDDLKNASDNNGVQLFSQIFDWFNFENKFRLWSNPSASFPDVAAMGKCSSGNCEIWDYRLAPITENKAYNNSAFNSSKNSAFISNSTCPTAVHGNEVTTADIPTSDSTFVSLTFLTLAEEISGDLSGNDNLLCESNEECLYHPNFGAYQGEGDPYASAPCVFQDGIISNVKMYGYPNN